MEQNVKPIPIFVDKINLAPDPSPTSNIQKTTKKIERDVNKILIVIGNDKFKHSVEIKKAFVKVFPLN